MSTAEEIAEFLTSRRAKITPDRAGLPSWGQRRVPGLRREEVASLAGVSLDYYKRLERGNLSGVSDGVLEALSGALQLDDAERAHLFDLARAANPAITRRRRPVPHQVRPDVQRILDTIGTPALVRNSRVDYLAANQLGRALYAPLFESPQQPPNSARFTFLDPIAVELYPEWEHVADELVAHLRSEAGGHPDDHELQELISELSSRSGEFRIRWQAHNVRFHRTGTKHLQHPIVGELTLTYETMELSADPGLTITLYTAEPRSKSEKGLSLLGSWAATPDEPNPIHAGDRARSGTDQPSPTGP